MLFRSGASYKIETNPIDLARSTYMLCDAAFLRVNTFAVLYKTLGLDANIAARDTLPWAFGGYSDGVKYEQNIRRLFSMDDNDVFITGMRLHDHLAQTNPVAWVKRELVKYSEL